MKEFPLIMRMTLYFNRNAQSLNEYAIIIAMITLGILGINIYLKRGIQNAIKSTADDLGSPAESFYKVQSQTLGAMELGLVEYSGLTDTTAEKRTTLVEVPPSGNNPVRTHTIVKDNSASTGSWSASYVLGASESFNAKEKTKKPSTGLIK